MFAKRLRVPRHYLIQASSSSGRRLDSCSLFRKNTLPLVAVNALNAKLSSCRRAFSTSQRRRQESRAESE